MQKQKQQGFSMFMGLYTLLTLIVVIFILFRIVPVYFDNYTIENSLSSLQGDTELQQQILLNGFGSSVNSAIIKRFEINNVTQITPDQVQVTPGGTGGTVRVVYDVKVPVIGNTSILLHFDDSTEISTTNVQS